MKFIADVHLGKLAKLLRMLGFDMLYNNSSQILNSHLLPYNKTGYCFHEMLQ
jgi:uncharacterized protein with PIN domain